jgi:hypothetical protein
MEASHPVRVSLNFMPAFYHRHLGLTYGEPYYFDPRYRAQVECQELRFLHQILGAFGVGSAAPQPSASLFIQPIDLIKLTQGAELHCPEDATLETRGHPWERLSPAEIARVAAPEAARHPVVDAVLRQYRELERLYGDAADLFGIKAGLMNVHAPYTTAHQLCGEGLFLLMVDDPQAAQGIFAKVWEIYQAVFDRLHAALRAPTPRRVQLGDCSAGLLSCDVYTRVVLPVNRTIARAFRERGYHSCGASSHLLAAFARMPRLAAVELGPGTDLAAAVRVLPGVAMHPLIDPVLMRNGDTQRVAAAVREVLDATAPAPATTLCAWSFDRDTPVANVEALYRTVECWTRGRPQMRQGSVACRQPGAPRRQVATEAS